MKIITRSLSIPAIALMLISLVGTSASAGATLLMQDDFHSRSTYQTSLNTSISARASGSLIGVSSGLTYAQKTGARDWQLAMTDGNYAITSMDTSHTTMYFCPNKNFKDFDHLVATVTVTPNSEKGHEYSTSPNNWVAVSFAGPAGGMPGVDDNCIFVKIQRAGKWWVYNHSKTPTSMDTMPLLGSGRYVIKCELWKVDGVYHYTIGVKDSRRHKLVDNDIVDGTFASSQISFIGGGVEAGKRTAHGWDDVAIEHVRDNFGEKWVQTHPFIVTAWVESYDAHLDSVFDGLGLTAASVFFDNPVNRGEFALAADDCYDHKVWRLANLRVYEDLDDLMRSTITRHTETWEDPIWYVRDEPQPYEPPYEGAPGDPDILTNCRTYADFCRAIRPAGPIFINVCNPKGWHGYAPNLMPDLFGIVKPEILSQDYYPFITTDGNPSDLIDGGILSQVMELRASAIEHNVPYFGYLQSFTRIGEGNDARTQSESEMRAQAYIYLALGFRGLQWFYLDCTAEGYSSLVLDGKPSEPLYGMARDTTAEMQRVGQYLRYLRNTHVTCVADSGGSVPIGLMEWSSSDDGDPYIAGITPLSGDTSDILVGSFVDKDNNRYLMLVNMSRGPELSADAAKKTIHVKFENLPGGSRIYHIRRDSGEEEELTLTNSNGMRELIIDIPGGTGELFAYNPGDFDNLNKDVTLVYDNCESFNSMDLNAEADIRQTGELTDGGTKYAKYRDTRKPGNEWQLRVNGIIKGGIAMSLQAPYPSPIVFGFDRGFRDFDRLRITCKMQPNAWTYDPPYTCSTQPDNWVGLSFLGNGGQAEADTGCSLRIKRNGEWAAYNYRATPFATGTLAHAADYKDPGTAYRVKVEMWRIGTAFFFSIWVDDRDGDGYHQLVDGQKADRATSNPYHFIQWSGHIADTTPDIVARHGFDDLRVERMKY